MSKIVALINSYEIIFCNKCTKATSLESYTINNHPSKLESYTQRDTNNLTCKNVSIHQHC